MGVRESAPVEVRLRHQAPCGIMLVRPRQSLRAENLDETQAVIVDELVTHPVGACSRRWQIEVGVLEGRNGTGRGGVADAVALPVVRPGLNGAVRGDQLGQVALDRPAQASTTTQ